MFKSKKNRFLSLASLTLAASLVLSACGERVIPAILPKERMLQDLVGKR
ncbi:hypothetical protein [Paenibacillus sp. DCT19]|nr:hypothetical protein [Paenibacillus sp. DCT19]